MPSQSTGPNLFLIVTGAEDLEATSQKEERRYFVERQVTYVPRTELLGLVLVLEPAVRFEVDKLCSPA